MIFQCPPWTELFLRYPPAASPMLESVALAAGIAGLLAGIGAAWRPRWAALLFAALAATNLALVAGAVAWRWGEYRR